MTSWSSRAGKWIALKESTPHPEARAYSSTYEGCEVMQQIEVEEPMDLQTTGVQRDMLFLVRAEGRYTVPTNPWPRNPEMEERDIAGVQKRKPIYTRDEVRVTAGTSTVLICGFLKGTHGE